MLNALSSINIPADCCQSKVNNNKFRVNAINAEVYRAITALLNDKGIQWHTFEDKQMRDIKVMIKVLHHSIDQTDIIQEPNRKGLKAKNARNKQKWLTAEQRQDRRVKGLQEVVPLDMFITSFDRGTDVDQIYYIKIIMSSKV
jgi:transcription initiation factor TFIIIB Brf1 subunit/transcription initiation factor TFIIB